MTSAGDIIKISPDVEFQEPSESIIPNIRVIFSEIKNSTVRSKVEENFKLQQIAGKKCALSLQSTSKWKQVAYL
jgi:hypothetical protein